MNEHHAFYFICFLPHSLLFSLLFPPPNHKIAQRAQLWQVFWLAGSVIYDGVVHFSIVSCSKAL